MVEHHKIITGMPKWNCSFKRETNDMLVRGGRAFCTADSCCNHNHISWTWCPGESHFFIIIVIVVIIPFISCLSFGCVVQCLLKISIEGLPSLFQGAHFTKPEQRWTRITWTPVHARQATLSDGIINKWLPDGCSWCTGTCGRRQSFNYVCLW